MLRESFNLKKILKWHNLKVLFSHFSIVHCSTTYNHYKEVTLEKACAYAGWISVGLTWSFTSIILEAT